MTARPPPSTYVLIAFTTGRGSAIGFPTIPVIKIATNSNTFRAMPDNMDVNAGAISDGVSPGVLRAERQTFGIAASERRLQGIVVIISAAGFVIDLGKAVAELADGRRRAGCGIYVQAGYQVGNTAQEQIATWLPT